MKFGYARVSKNEQSLDVQIQKLTQAGCDEIFKEKVSGAKDDRSQLNSLIGKLRKGDTICVVRLDRLGRRMTKLITLINDFKTKGVEFISLEDNIDTTTPMGMLLFSMCAAFSEMERILITERIKAGLNAAHSKGRKGGRARTLTPDKLKKLKSLKKSQDFSVTEICHMVGISRSVYYRAITEKLAK
ncbi:recombinase family protein [Candidatus Tisiphia endosymbiont of Ceraclea dissimilis]|uniref:recombinase family protein n=1 Tax=Candidatus Tisiphia endosymbiont of Ceraclea dissimilis TaxID=3077928 RepID=UPI003CCB2259